MFDNIIFPILLIAVIALFVFVSEERKKLRGDAYREGIGEEYDLELKRLLELQSFGQRTLLPGQILTVKHWTLCV